MSYMARFLLNLFILSLASSAWAGGRVSLTGLGMHLEPVIGYETVFRDTPTPHTATRTIYGARLSAGVDLLSAELEYTKGSDTENFSAAPEKIFSEDEKAKLGIRSTYHFNSYFFISGRLGDQGTRGYTEKTSGGVMVRTDNPITYSPYAGASLGVSLGSFVSISAGSTMVFKDNSDVTKNDVQNTLSISIGMN